MIFFPEQFNPENGLEIPIQNKHLKHGINRNPLAAPEK